MTDRRKHIIVTKTGVFSETSYDMVHRQSSTLKHTEIQAKAKSNAEGQLKLLIDPSTLDFLGDMARRLSSAADDVRDAFRF